MYERDLADLKRSLSCTDDFQASMHAFLDLAERHRLMDHSAACPHPTLQATLSKVVCASLGTEARFRGLTLRYGGLLHGGGVTEGRVSHPVAFFYCEDLALGLACIFGLPGGESRLTRFRLLQTPDAPELN